MALTDEEKQRISGYFTPPAQQPAIGAAPVAQPRPPRPQQGLISDDEWNYYLQSIGVEPNGPAGGAASAGNEGFFSNIKKGFVSGAAGVGEGIASLPGQNALSDYLEQVGKNNQRAREHDTIFSWDYVTDPSGLTYDLANQAGSMAALAPAAMLAPEGAVAAGGLRLLNFARKFGVPGRWIARKLGKEGAKDLIAGAFTAIPESLSEAGQTKKMLQQAGDEDANLKAAGVFAKNMALLPFTNAIEWAAVKGGIKGAMAKQGEGLLTRVAKAPLRALPPAALSGVMNGIEEFEQTTFQNEAEGKQVGSLFNPSSWTDEQRQALEVGALGSFLLAGAPGAYRSARQFKESGKQELNPYEQAIASVADMTKLRNNALNTALGEYYTASNGGFNLNPVSEEMQEQFNKDGKNPLSYGAINIGGTLFKGNGYGVDYNQAFDEMSADELQDYIIQTSDSFANDLDPSLKDNIFFNDAANEEYINRLDNLLAMKRAREAAEGKAPQSTQQPTQQEPTAAPAPGQQPVTPATPVQPQQPAQGKPFGTQISPEETAPLPMEEPPEAVAPTSAPVSPQGQAAPAPTTVMPNPTVVPQQNPVVQQPGQAIAQPATGVAPAVAPQVQQPQGAAPQIQQPVQQQPAAPATEGQPVQQPTAEEPAPAKPEERSPYFDQGAALAKQHGGVSKQFLKNQLKIGDGKAKKLIRDLQDAGIIGMTPDKATKKYPYIGKGEEGNGETQLPGQSETEGLPGSNPEPGQGAAEEGQNGQTAGEQGQTEVVTAPPVETAAPEQAPETKPVQEPAETPAPTEETPAAKPETEEAPAETAAPEETAPEEEGPKEEYETDHFEADMFEHTQTHKMLPRAVLKEKISDEEWTPVNKIAKKYHGKWSKFAKGFLFYVSKDTPDPIAARDAFIKEAEDILGGGTAEAPATTAAPQEAPAPTPTPTAEAPKPEAKPEEAPKPKSEGKPKVTGLNGTRGISTVDGILQPKNPDVQPVTGKPKTEAEPKKPKVTGLDGGRGLNTVDGILQPKNPNVTIPKPKAASKPKTNVTQDGGKKNETISFGGKNLFTGENDVSDEELINTFLGEESSKRAYYDFSANLRYGIILNAKSSEGQSNATITFNPKDVATLLQLGGRFIEQGYDSYDKWSQHLTEKLGQRALPYMDAIWEMLKVYPSDQQFNPKLMTGILEVVGSYSGDMGYDGLRQYWKDRYGEETLSLFDTAVVGWKTLNGEPIETPAVEAPKPQETTAAPEAEPAPAPKPQAPPVVQEGDYVPEGGIPTEEQEEPKQYEEDKAFNPHLVKIDGVDYALPAARRVEEGFETSEKFIFGVARKHHGVWDRNKKMFVFPVQPDSNWGTALRNRENFIAEVNTMLGYKPIKKEENNVPTGEGVQGVPEGEAPGGVPVDETGGDTGPVLPGQSGPGAGGLPSNPVGPGTAQPGETQPNGLPGYGGGISVTAGASEGADIGPAVRDGLTPGQRTDANQSEIPGHDFAYEDQLSAPTTKIDRFKRNLVALETLVQLNKDNRKATPSEQALLAGFTGWGGLSDLMKGCLEEDNMFHDMMKDYVERVKNLQDEINFISGATADYFRRIGDGRSGIVYTIENKAVNSYVNTVAAKRMQDVPFEVARQVWSILSDRLGFKGGRVFNAFMGTGTFFGAMPKEMRAQSSLAGSETMAFERKMAEQLYQKAYISDAAIDKMQNPANFYDLTVGSIPHYNSEHYYAPIVEKLIETTRPDGIIAIVADPMFLDDRDSDALAGRLKIAKQVEFLGAIRLPNESTEAGITSDLIFMRKLKQGEKYNEADAWYSTDKKAVPYEGDEDNDSGTKEVSISNYYIDNPGMLIGETQFTERNSGSYSTQEATNADTPERMAADALSALQEKSKQLKSSNYQDVTADVSEQTKQAQEATKTFLNSVGKRKISLVADENGQIGQETGNGFKPIPAQEQGRAKAYLSLLDKVKNLLQKESEMGVSSETIEQLRAELNQAYDDYVENFGYVNSEDSLKIINKDPDNGFVKALEKYDYDPETKTETASKKGLLIGRMRLPAMAENAPQTTEDALNTCLSNIGFVDVKYIADLMGKKVPEVLEELEGHIFLDPATRTYVTKDEYLSGNVREKLETAQAAAERVNPVYNKNVKALQENQPKDRTPDKIIIRMGSPFTTADDYKEFLKHLLHTSMDLFNVMYLPKSGEWLVNWKGTWERDHFKSNTGNYATPRHSFLQIVNYAISQRGGFDFKTADPNDPSGKKKIQDLDEINAVQNVMEDINNQFTDWIKNQPERVARITAEYNRKYNNTVLREYNGSHLTLPGLALGPKMRKHQLDVIWRMMQKASTLLAHCVGAGKTWAMQIAGMEMKRIGMCKKPVYTVLGHMVAQFEQEFREIYPNAKILVLNADNLPDVYRMSTKLRDSLHEAKMAGRTQDVEDALKKFKEKKTESDNRRRIMLEEIANGEWDAIICSHDTFGRLPMSTRSVIESGLAEIRQKEEAIRELRTIKWSGEAAGLNEKLNSAIKALEDEMHTIAVSALKTLRDSDYEAFEHIADREMLRGDKAEDWDTYDIVNYLEDRQSDIDASDNSGSIIPFEKLGIDQLFVDEADNFKNIVSKTKMGDIRGLTAKTSGQAADMMQKTQYLERLTNGRGVVFATGTPISNSLSEMYTMMRYMAPQMLQDLNLDSFDKWAALFAKHTMKEEQTPKGNEAIERFTSFVNSGELVRLFRVFTDVKTRDELNLPTPALKNGERTKVAVDPSAEQDNFLNDWILRRAEAVAQGQPLIKGDCMSKINFDLRYGSLDLRIVSPNAPATAANAKTRACAENIFQKYKESNDIKGAQLVFCDISAPTGVYAIPKNANRADYEVTKKGEDPNAKKFANVYQDLKNHLISLGIPAEEIAFVQDVKGKNAADKQEKLNALFKKVRQGKIRVLLGSTETMGAGTNCQERLVALHHLDCPHRPRDIEQREGRILRQGNINEEVEIFTYVTKRSYDKDMWERIARKAAMINQAMSGDFEQTTIEEVDTVELDFATIRAHVLGDPLLAEREVLQAEIAKMAAQYKRYLNKQKDNKKELAELEGVGDKYLKIIDRIKGDMEKMPDLSGDKFSITLMDSKNGVTTFGAEQKAEAADRLKFIVDKFFNSNKMWDTNVGSIGGFKIRLDKVYSNKGELEVRPSLVGAHTYLGNTSSIEGILYIYRQGIKKALDANETMQSSLESNIQTLKDALSREFPDQEKMAASIDRMNEIDRLLAEKAAQAADSNSNNSYRQVNYQAAAEGNPILKREMDTLVAEAKEAFKGAKDVAQEGNYLFFTMENGVKVAVSIRDKFVVTGKDAEKCRKDHGITNANSPVQEVQGYSETLSSGAAVGLSLCSQDGVAFHEAAHTVYHTVLNDKERAAIRKHFKDEAAKTGKSVEELFAEDHRAWRLERKGERKSFFGKIHQRIMDFLKGLKAFFTGVETLQDLHRQIENGKVWKRKPGKFIKSGKNFLDAGEKAANADLKALETAKKMFEQGFPMLDIYKQTKWWLEMDGAWRFEIPTYYSHLAIKNLPRANTSKKLETVYTNTAIYDAYPELRNKNVEGEKMERGLYGGANPYTGDLKLNTRYTGPRATSFERLEMLKTLEHETQHIIQGIEGWANGGNPNTVKMHIQNEIDKLKKAASDIHPLASTYYDLINRLDNAFISGDEAKMSRVQQALFDFNKAVPGFTEAQKYMVCRYLDHAAQMTKEMTGWGNEFELYQKLGGEQEARWAESRLSQRYLLMYAYKTDDSLLQQLPQAMSKDAIIYRRDSDSVLFMNADEIGRYMDFTKPVQKDTAQSTSILQASIAETTTPELKRGVDEIEAEAKKAFPGAKNFKREGQHMTFTMPNGTEIAVDISNQVIISGKEAEKARKEHGKNLTEPIRLNGYAETFGKNAAVTLAENGDKGTAFHESYHVAWNLVLTDKEKAAMLKHYKPEAAKLHKAVSEVMADAYRDWQLARQQHKGTIFGKLQQKIKDFAMKAAAILTGTENVHNVMRKISEGEVWSREVPTKLADGYRTESGMPLKTANRYDFIVRPDGNKNFGHFDKSVEKATGGKVRAVPIRVQVGFNNEKDEGFGIIHIKKREGALQKLGYKNAEDFIEDIINNYQKIYTDPKAPNRIKLIMKNDKFNVMPLDIVLVKEKGEYYTVVSAVPKNLSRESKEKGTLIYDRSASLSSATSSGPAQNRGDGQIAGTVPQSATDKSNVPFVDNNISQNEQNDNRQYSVSSAIDTGIKKAEQYANRNVREANLKTAEGRTSQIFANTRNKNKSQSVLGYLKDVKDKFYREWVDKNDALHTLDKFIETARGKKLTASESIYNRAQMMNALANGAANTLIQGDAKSLDALRNRIGRDVDPKDKAANERKQYLKNSFKNVSMQDVLNDVMSSDMDKKYPSYLEKHGINTWREAFSNYLGARRLLELLRIAKAEGREEDYKLPKGISEADLEAVVKHAPKEFDSAAKKYYQLQKNLLILMEDGGLITKEIHDYINETYSEYCPLMIDYSDTAALDKVLNRFAKEGNSIVNVSSMLKHVLEEGSEHGLMSPLEATYKSIQMLSERAERNKVGVHFVKMVSGDKELMKSGLLKKIEGSKAADPKNCIFTVLIDGKKVAFQTTQDMYGPIVGFDDVSAGITFNLAANAAKCLRAGATTSPSFIIRNFIRDTIFAGISSRNGFVPVVDSFKGMWAYLHDKELRGEFDAMGITSYNFFGSTDQAVKSMDELMGDKSIPHTPWGLLKAIVGKAQEYSEIVEASTRMGEYMRARASGKSMEQAALDAREVTLDFSRSGRQGRQINKIVPFFNAAIQGGDKMLRLMMDKDTREHTMRMLGQYILLPSLLLWAINHDEPWYEELDPHIKMNNWILPGGVRIPKPQEAGVVFGSGLEALMDKLADKDPAAMKNWLKAFRDVALPNMIPTLALPLLEWVTNYSLFREQPLEGNRLKRLPVELRYNPSTSELSKAIGNALGLSPVKLDNTARGYLGTMGMLAWQLPDFAFEQERNLPSKQLNERAFFRDFFLNDMNMNRTNEDFYELVSAAQQRHAGYGKKNKPDAATSAVSKASRDVSKQYKEIQEITKAKGMNPDRKRQLIDRKRQVIHQIQKATLKRYREKYDI